MSLRQFWIAASFAALVTSGCASDPDPGYISRTRSERPYLGGAAAAPEAVAGPPLSVGQVVEGIAWIGAFAAACFGLRGVDVSTSPRPQDWSPAFERPGPPPGR